MFQDDRLYKIYLLTLYLQLPNKLVYWRALLQQVLVDQLGYVCNDWRVGKISPKTLNFVSYARKALSRLAVASQVDP